VKKLLVIAWKEVVLRFTDAAVLLLTIAAPLAITALIDLAFGDIVLSRGVPDTRIPVGIVNRDLGGEWGNFGEVIVRALSPASGISVFDGDAHFELLAVHEIGDETRARRMVRQGKLIAALLIPPDFSSGLMSGNAALEVYLNDAYDFRGTAFTSVVGTLVNRITTAEAAVHTTVEGLARHPSTRAQLRAGRLHEAIAELALTAALPETNPITVQRVNAVGRALQVELTHYLAAAIAISFTGFTALMGSASLLQEKTRGTLQRMYVTPTRPGVILGGKTLGTYLNGLVQMGALVGGVAAVERILSGSPDQGPHVDPCGLAMLILAVVAAATGVGVTIAGFARTYVQAANYGRAVILLMGLLGGVFFPAALFSRPFDVLSRFTFQYWAMDGYLKVAAGGDVATILPHVLILWAMAASFFGIGNGLLKRRIGLS